MGKLTEINKFDATFFGVPWDKAESMDPQGRLLMEKTYEAIVDAGITFIYTYFQNEKLGQFEFYNLQN